MPVAEITKVLTFHSAHRVLGHESKCRFLHGHSYSAEVTVSAESLDDLGRVIDFSFLKSKVGGWIDEQWDHNVIIHPKDPLLALYDFEQDSGVDGELSVFKGRAPYVMPKEFANPTVENMACWLYKVAKNLLANHDIRVARVRLHETATCYADYPPRNQE